MQSKNRSFCFWTWIPHFLIPMASVGGGTGCSSTGVVDFLQALLDEFGYDYPDIPLLLRGDSCFTKPELYEQCGTNGVSYVIRLKESPLRALASEIEKRLIAAIKKADILFCGVWRILISI